MQELRIIGYSSDDVQEVFHNEQIFKAKQRLKRVCELNKQEELARQSQTFDRESHVYLVRGEKRYYRVYRDAKIDFIGYGKVEYLGMAQEPILVPKEVEKPKLIKKVIGRTKAFEDGMICCYCELKLTPKNYTREHVIPKHKGGKIIMPCCNVCNNEKGGLMLHSYIQMLNLMMNDFKDDELGFSKNKIKIINANKIAKELNL